MTRAPGVTPPRIRRCDFRPAWWLRSAHAQTLWASLCRLGPRPPLKRQRVELRDGDFLDLDWGPAPHTSRAPLVVVLHGLEGSSSSAYARGLLSSLHGVGMQSVVMHFRGCGGELNRLVRTYHSGETSDLDTLLRWLRRAWPGRPLAAVGYSLGGNVLLKWLGERGSGAALDAAAAACVPLELADSARRLEQGFSRVYLWRLVRDLKRKIARKYRHRPGPLDLPRVRGARGFREFDDLVTAPLHGFRDADDYYRECSGRRFLHAIHRPTLIVQARDDPFMSTAALPEPEELGPGVTLEVANGGGHVGFVAGSGLLGLKPSYWLERRLTDFLREQLAGDVNRTRSRLSSR